MVLSATKREAQACARDQEAAGTLKVSKIQTIYWEDMEILCFIVGKIWDYVFYYIDVYIYVCV